MRCIAGKIEKQGFYLRGRILLLYSFDCLTNIAWPTRTLTGNVHTAQCTLDVEDICVGCYRTMVEICDWLDYSEEQRAEAYQRIEQRKQAKILKHRQD